MNYKRTTCSEKELLNAYRLIFLKEPEGRMDILRMLSIEELKNAYRMKAMDTHPDRARILGKDESLLAKDFKEIIIAYEMLLTFLNSRPLWTKSQQANRPRGKYYRKSDDATFDTSKNEWFGGLKDYYHKGKIPSVELLFAQFLYYSGKISWKTLHSAILWQRKHRPRFGQIALDWGILDRKDITHILRNRSLHEKFGEYAFRKGFISAFHKIAIMGKQSMLQPQIGSFFVEKGILNNQEIEEYTRLQRKHNQQVRIKKFNERK